MNTHAIDALKKQFNYFPSDVPVCFPQASLLPEADQHFLIYIPWEEQYLLFVPKEFQRFYKSILPFLAARTTDVHTAVCMQYLDEFIDKAIQAGHQPNRTILAYALMLHDSGWSQMTEAEIAASLGVSGLKLTDGALAPKEKHAVLGAEIARQVLTEQKEIIGISESEIEVICKAILYHDKPEAVAGLGKDMPIEVQLLVDLDHLWSFTHFNFWQDTLRKGVSPEHYLLNLKADLDSYFVTHIGKDKAKQMLLEREKEVQY